MAKTLQLQIVTPEGVVFSEEVDMVSLDTVDGQLGILPNHIRLITQLVPGELMARKDGSDKYLAVGEGYVEVIGDDVAVLTDMAVAVEDIDEARVEEMRRQAVARLSENISDEEAASVSTCLARSLAQLYVKRLRRG